MPASPSYLSTALASTLLLAVGLAGAGCGTKPKADSFDAAVAAGERPVAMQGDMLFFGGELDAKVTISRGVGHGGGGGGKGHKGGAEPAEGERLDADSYTAYISARGALGSPLPPITLHLKLENRSGKIFQVDIEDFNSELGNFAIEPSLLSLAPGQIAEPNPMVSQLGVTSDTIPVTVTLRKDGQTESHVINVVSVAGPDAATTQPSPPPPPPPNGF